MKILKLIDIYGQPYRLTFNKEENFTNSLGGIFTIITAALVIAIIYALGGEIFSKTRPKLVSNIDVNPYRRNYTYDIAAAFVLEKTEFGVVDDWERYIEFHTFFYETTAINGLFQTISVMEIPFRKCVPEDFDYNSKPHFEFNQLEKANCLDFDLYDKDLTIGGYWNIPYNKFIKIVASPCKNITKHSCYDEKKIKQFLGTKDKQIAIYFEDVSFLPRNHDKPFEFSLKPLYTKI